MAIPRIFILMTGHLVRLYSREMRLRCMICAGFLSIPLFFVPALSLAASLNICEKLAEPVWVPPTPLDAAECIEENHLLCLGLPHCCSPKCRLHPECVLGGTFVDGHWDDLHCELLEPEDAIERFVRGALTPADDFLAPIRLAAQTHIEGLERTGRSIPGHIQGLVNDIINSLPGRRAIPRFKPIHVEKTRLQPREAHGAAIYLPDERNTEAITLDNLVIMRNNFFNDLVNEPPTTFEQFRCLTPSVGFREAVILLMHELIHVRQWDELGRDTFLNNYILEVLARGYGNDSFEHEAFKLTGALEFRFVAPSPLFVCGLLIPPVIMPIM